MIHQLENVSLKDTHGVEYTAVKLEHAFREFVIFGTLGALFEAVNSALNLKKEGKCPANSANALAVMFKCNSRYASKIVGWSTRVKSAVHGKIFKTTSDTNLSAFSNNFLKSKVNHTFLMTKIQFQNVISLAVILKIMYLKPFKNSTYSVVFQNRASSPP